MTVHTFDYPEPADRGSAARAPKRLSCTLRKLAHPSLYPITVQGLAEVIAGRSLGAILAFFAILNCIPAPPGASFFLGLPVVFIAAQLVTGKSSVWLPRRVARIHVTRAGFVGTIDRMLDCLAWLETFLKPRYWPFPTGAGERFVGVVSLLLGVIVVLPIPLGNGAPAFAIALLGIALSERDGLWLLVALVAATLSALLAGSIVVGAAWAVGAAWGAGV